MQAKARERILGCQCAHASQPRQTCSVRCAKPRVGCCVRASKSARRESMQAATNLFMRMSRRSNWGGQTQRAQQRVWSTARSM